MVKDITGEKFGKLKVLRRVENNRRGDAMWLCQCECGNTKIVRGYNLRSGHTKSCGCYIVELTVKRQLKHGLSKHPLYNVWYSLIDRCTNTHHRLYNRYGARGITVCKQWLDSYEEFYHWAISNGWKKGLQIDRRNNDGNYEPENCRFVTAKDNIRNSTVASSLTKSLADKIRKEYIPHINGYKKLGEKYNTSWSNVRNIIKRGQWR